jgi:hypothetical protein
VVDTMFASLRLHTRGRGGAKTHANPAPAYLSACGGSFCNPIFLDSFYMKIIYAFLLFILRPLTGSNLNMRSSSVNKTLSRVKTPKTISATLSAMLLILRLTSDAGDVPQIRGGYEISRRLRRNFGGPTEK